MYFLEILHIPETCIASRHSAPSLLVDIPQILWKFCIFPEHLPEHQPCLFQTFHTFPRHVLYLLQTFQTFSSPVHIWLMFQMLPIFSGHLPNHQGGFFLDIPDTPRTCSTFGIFISGISDIQQLIYVCTCSGSSAFLQEIYTSAMAVFFSDIPDTLRTCITFNIFISDISDIQHLISVCTCSGSSAFFEDIYLSTRAVCFRIFRTLSGHVLHLTYLFRIFRTFSSSFICAHALEVPHLFRTFARAPGMFFFRIFRTLPRHVLQVAYLFRILRTFSSSFISAHAPEVPHFFTTLSEINVPNVIHVLRVSGIFGKKTSLVLGQVS